MITSGNLTTTVSDHLPQIFIHPEFNKTFILRKHNIYKRNTDKYDRGSFKTGFQNTEWKKVIDVNNNNTDKRFDSLRSIFQ